MTSHDFNKIVFKNNHFVNTGMSSSNSKRNKGKAPIQGFLQKMHEGASSGKEPRKATSLQTMYPEAVTYSSGYMAITLQKVFLQEVKNKALQFSKGVYKDLPPSTKFILDNLQRAFTQYHYSLFQRTLKALELHLVELEAGNAILTSQLFGKEDIHSMDKTTIMGTDYARLSLKTQNQL